MKPAKPTLGSLLKGLRTRNGWTLKEMSERTGIPFSSLSKVEHDRLTLTYDKLQQISERLHIRMSDLFAEPDTNAPPVMARRSVGTLETVISQLDGWPACAPANASPVTLRPPAHDGGSSWFAGPCLYGSFIRYSTPVYPGAFAASPFPAPVEEVMSIKQA